MSEAHRDAALIRWIRKNQPFRTNYKWLDHLAKTRESGEWVPELDLDPMYHERRECLQCLQADNGELAAQLASARAEIERLKAYNETRTAEVLAATQQLAAEQAKNLGMRDALNRLQEACNGEDDNEFYAANSAATKYLSTLSDTSALESYVTKAGEKMREKCLEEFSKGWIHADSVENEIHTLPGVTLEDLK